MPKLSHKDIKKELEFNTAFETRPTNLGWFKSLVDRKKYLKLNPSYQRGEIWSEEGMKSLIKSLISGIAIPPITLNERLDEEHNRVYDVMDGKQRLTTILDFIDNKYSINLNGKQIYYNLEDEENSYCFDIGVIDDFLNIPFQVVIYKNLDEFQQRDIFERINYGSPLKLGEKLKGSNAPGITTIKKLIDLYSKKFEDDLCIKNERHSHYLKFGALIALQNKDYKSASSGAPVVKYMKETFEDNNNIFESAKEIIDKLFNLHNELIKYHDTRVAKQFSKLWNWSEIMFMVYILTNRQEKDVVKFNKFLWHLKYNSIKINEWVSDDIDDFKDQWKKLGRKNTNFLEIYEERGVLFDKILNLINKQIPSSLRNELALKKFRDADKKNCPVCNKHTIEKSNYQAGHIISRKNGGCVNINNIIPICQTCNTSMGSKDLDIYCQENNFSVPVFN